MTHEALEDPARSIELEMFTDEEWTVRFDHHEPPSTNKQKRDINLVAQSDEPCPYCKEEHWRASAVHEAVHVASEHPFDYLLGGIDGAGASNDDKHIAQAVDELRTESIVANTTEVQRSCPDTEPPLPKITKHGHPLRNHDRLLPVTKVAATRIFAQLGGGDLPAAKRTLAAWQDQINQYMRVLAAADEQSPIEDGNSWYPTASTRLGTAMKYMDQHITDVTSWMQRRADPTAPVTYEEARELFEAAGNWNELSYYTRSASTAIEDGQNLDAKERAKPPKEDPTSNESSIDDTPNEHTNDPYHGDPSILPSLRDHRKADPLTAQWNSGEILGVDNGLGFGDMFIETPDLIYPLIKKPRHDSFMGDIGLRMHTPHRIMIDGKPYKNRKKGKGGTVLIDFSGSMYLQDEQLIALAQTAPASTIALYEGDRIDGRLTVIAANGMRCHDKWIARRWGENIVDGPAVHWLASQPEPRVWVTDGKMTGRDLARINVLDWARVIEFCRVHRINVVETPHAARKVLAARPRKSGFVHSEILLKASQSRHGHRVREHMTNLPL